jgi:hypothetical protein
MREHAPWLMSKLEAETLHLQYGLAHIFSRGHHSSEHYYCRLVGDESRLLVCGYIRRFGMVSMTPLPQRVMHKHALHCSNAWFWRL